MSLITEDGTGRADAESFASLAAADAYHASRGNVAWAGALTADKENALRRATDYIGQEYRTKWKGRRTTMTQALDWPRYEVKLDDVGFGRYAAYVQPTIVPAQVVQACCELAIRALSGPLAPDLQRQIIAETVGPLRTEYAAGTPEYVRYRSVDLLLKPLLASSGMGIQMVRA
ncbi:MAG TPA: DnaT-like ssDNA-binding protein [Rhodocyclaceae bacterium]|nr:DnaT-like ssDNA-binding protein [Rhodocyclaceae bacterium]